MDLFICLRRLPQREREREREDWHALVMGRRLTPSLRARSCVKTIQATAATTRITTTAIAMPPAVDTMLSSGATTHGCVYAVRYVEVRWEDPSF